MNLQQVQELLLSLYVSTCLAAQSCCFFILLLSVVRFEMFFCSSVSHHCKRLIRKYEMYLSVCACLCICLRTCACMRLFQQNQVDAVNKNPNLLHNHTLTFTWKDSACSESQSLRVFSELLAAKTALQGIIGPECSVACEVIAYPCAWLFCTSVHR